MKSENINSTPLIKYAHTAYFKNGYLGVSVGKPDFAIPDGLLDRGEFHITILSPAEVRDLKKRLPEKLYSPIGIAGYPSYLGVGMQKEPGNEVYFVVVEWLEAQKVRESLGFAPKDLHITMGFRVRDIHNAPKDKSTLIL